VKDLEKAPLFIDDSPSLLYYLILPRQDVWFHNGINYNCDYSQLMTAGGNGKGGGNRAGNIYNF
jgi:replicative DNA helicase